MSKNYDAIHYIQSQLAGYKPEFINCVVRCFDMIDQNSEPDGCLSNTVALYICAKEYGYSPEICYGLCSLDGKQFYHAWLELDGIVIDLSIYGNVNFSSFSVWNFCLNKPFVGSYEDAFVVYGKFVFDDEWTYSGISRMEGWSLDKYMNTLPSNAMWKLVCKFLDVVPSKRYVDHLHQHIAGVSIEQHSN